MKRNVPKDFVSRQAAVSVSRLHFLCFANHYLLSLEWERSEVLNVMIHGLVTPLSAAVFPSRDVKRRLGVRYENLDFLKEGFIIVYIVEQYVV